MKRGIKLMFAAAVLFALWVLTAPFLARGLIVERQIEKADVIFVLSGSAAYRERTEMAAELYEQGIADEVVLSDDGEMAGWSQEDQGNPRFVELARRSLIKNGVDKSSVVILAPVVSGTIDEARAFAERAKQEDWKSVMLVTSKYHTRRAAAAFEKETHSEAVNVGVKPALPGRRTPGEYTWWFSPRGWKHVGGEYLKSAYYWLFY
ncbi:MAG: YdcF family protein [Pyrinomonadaceae bacterium]|nr:YdcF family protein [Pyrinomonadaceae bacterium]